jgi:hypothetical protein
MGSTRHAASATTGDIRLDSMAFLLTFLMVQDVHGAAEVLIGCEPSVKAAMHTGFAGH